MKKEDLNVIPTVNKHKWDKITDTCTKCGVQRRIKTYYNKSATFILGKITEYFINNEWTTTIPNCNSIKKIKS